ncbi:hypothetical protein [Mycoplasma simbae]|uniref:hypothetical protein n=1 Tax=Mycoplasma simbae TaxID=36744 RepID=UPI00049694C2|nr:hypothetical protein [Mycoplasma simbae]
MKRKKHTFEEKVDIWQKVIDKNYHILKSRTWFNIQSTSIIALLFSAVFGLLIYALVRPATSNTVSATNISAVVIIGLCAIAVWYFVSVNIFFFSIVKRVEKGADIFKMRKQVQLWIRLGLIRWPSKYILPTEDDIEKFSK